MRIALISQGREGLPWAARLLCAGHSVSVMSEDPGFAPALAALCAVAVPARAALSDLPAAEPGELRLFAEPPADLAVFELVLICGPADHRLLMRAAGHGGALQIGTGGHLPRLAGVAPEWLIPAFELRAADLAARARLEPLLCRAGLAPVDPARFEAARALAASVADLPAEAQISALTGLLRSLRDRGLGLGALLLEADQAALAGPTPAVAGPIALTVLPSWIDYNGHMTESRYLHACSEVTDAFLRRIGAGLDYVASGRSFFTAETHLRHLREAKLGEALTGEALLLAVAPRRLHLLTRICRAGEPLATLEQVLVHVDLRSGRAVAAEPAVLAAAQAALWQGPWPDWLGRGIRRFTG